MKKNTKGFTLIELLAVIVILAIIALIATPIVLSLIERARKGAAESSAYAYIKAAETAAVYKLFGNSSLNLASQTCTVDATDGTKLNCVDPDNTVLELDVKGNLPKAGSTVTFDDKGTVTAINLTIGAYNVTLNDKLEAQATKASGTTPAQTTTSAS